MPCPGNRPQRHRLERRREALAARRRASESQAKRQEPKPFQAERLTRTALLGDPAFRLPADLKAIRPGDDDKQIITVGTDDTIRFWDAATGKELRRLEMPDLFSLYDVCFLPDGKRVLSMSAYKTRKISIWDLKTGVLDRAVEFPEYLSSPVVSSNGRQVFVWGGEGGGKIIQFDLETGAEVRRFTRNEGEISSQFDLTPDGRTLVTVASSVSLWDVASSRLLRKLDTGNIAARHRCSTPGRFR